MTTRNRKATNQIHDLYSCLHDYHKRVKVITLFIQLLWVRNENIHVLITQSTHAPTHPPRPTATSRARRKVTALSTACCRVTTAMTSPYSRPTSTRVTTARARGRPRRTCPSRTAHVSRLQSLTGRCGNSVAFAQLLRPG